MNARNSKSSQSWFFLVILNKIHEFLKNLTKLKKVCEFKKYVNLKKFIKLESVHEFEKES